MRPTLNDLQDLVKLAGEILRSGYGQEHQVNHKGRVDLVTEIDHLSEAALIAAIRSRFPTHHILAEESGSLTGGEGDDHFWYIDPLDGTVNYAHQVPLFTVSVAYAYRGQVQLGAIYDPMRDECYYGERGHGAWLNGCRLSVSHTTELVHSLLVTGFPYDTWESVENNLNHFARFTMRSQGVRRLGSAALDLCYVAAGRLDGFWEIRINSWDIAAGGLLVEEAGGIVTKIDGAPDYLSPPCSILAANPALYPQMLELLQTA